MQVSLLKYKQSYGSVSANASLHDAIKAISSAEKKFIEKPDKNIQKVDPKPHRQRNVIATLHFVRGGSGLPHNLIDAYKEISTLPSIYFNEFFDAAIWQ